MKDTYKFPGGKDVTVFRKEDVINNIKCNIVDTEVALALVRQCEMDAVNFLRKGRWTGVPFIGSIRPSKVKLLNKTKEQQEALQYAKETLTNEQYVMFKKATNHENFRKIKAQKHFNYVLSMVVAKDRVAFKKAVREKGYAWARIQFYLKHSICATQNELIRIEDAENSNY